MSSIPHPAASGTSQAVSVPQNLPRLPSLHLLYPDHTRYDADGKRRLKAKGPQAACTGYSLSFYEGEDLVCQVDAGDAVHPDAAYRSKYLLTDHLGTTRAELTVDAQGAPRITQTYDTMPYGELINPPANPMEYMLFTGKERDAESGLDFFLARYYHSESGRWNSPDFLFADTQLWNPQSWNSYCYVKNSPIIFIDPTGTTVNKGDLTQDQQDQLLKQLSLLTGYEVGLNGIYWDGNGNLALSEKAESLGGSETARNNLTSFISPEVGTAVLTNGEKNNQVVGNAVLFAAYLNGTNIVVLDFSDYRKVKNNFKPNEQVTFSSGMDLFHELGHYFFGYADPNKDGSEPPGKTYAWRIDNKIREELRLPTRKSYSMDYCKPGSVGKMEGNAKYYFSSGSVFFNVYELAPGKYKRVTW